MTLFVVQASDADRRSRDQKPIFLFKGHKTVNEL